MRGEDMMGELLGNKEKVNNLEEKRECLKEGFYGIC